MVWVADEVGGAAIVCEACMRPQTATVAAVCLPDCRISRQRMAKVVQKPWRRCWLINQDHQPDHLIELAKILAQRNAWPLQYMPLDNP